MTDTERMLRLKLIVSRGFPANNLEADIWYKFGRAIAHDEFDELDNFIKGRLGINEKPTPAN